MMLRVETFALPAFESPQTLAGHRPSGREERFVLEADDRVLGAAVDLKAWKVAKHAADVVRGLLHEPDFLIGVKPRLRGDRIVIEILVTCLTESIACCLPRSVNGVPVEARAVNLSRKGA
jgi:hypothetical protein